MNILIRWIHRSIEKLVLTECDVYLFAVSVKPVCISRRYICGKCGSSKIRFRRYT